VNAVIAITTDHSFPRQFFPNSAAHCSKFSTYSS